MGGHRDRDQPGWGGHGDQAGWGGQGQGWGTEEWGHGAQLSWGQGRDGGDKAGDPPGLGTRWGRRVTPPPQEDYYVTPERLWVPLRWVAPELLARGRGGLAVGEQSKESNVW